MTLTVKLPESLERDLDIHCKLHRTTKTEVVTKLIYQYLALQQPKKSPAQIAREVGFGEFSGPPDLAERAGRHVKEKLRAKHSRVTRRRARQALSTRRDEAVSRLRLTDRDRDKFLRVLDNPPAPAKALRRALAR